MLSLLATSVEGGVWRLFSGVAPDDKKDFSGIELKESFFKDPERMGWAHIIFTTETKTHPVGAFSISTQDIDDMVRNFYAQSNPLPMNREHKATDEQGWVLGLERRGDDLWAVVEYTQDAADKVKSKVLQFTSVEITLDSRDRNTGESIGAELLGLALTNKPYIDGQSRLELSRNSRRSLSAGGNMSDKELVTEAFKALGDDANLEKVTQWVNARRQLDSVESGKGDSKSEAKAEDTALTAESAEKVALNTEESEAPASADEEAAEASAMNLIESFAQATGMDPVAVMAALEEYAAEVVAVISGNPEDGTQAEAEASRVIANARVEAADVRVAKLESRLAELEQEKTERQIDDAIACGNILEKDREKMVKLSRQAPELLADFLAPEKPAVPTGSVYKATRTSAQPRSGSAPNLSPSEMKTYRCAVAAGITKEKAIKLAQQSAESN